LKKRHKIKEKSIFDVAKNQLKLAGIPLTMATSQPTLAKIPPYGRNSTK